LIAIDIECGLLGGRPGPFFFGGAVTGACTDAEVEVEVEVDADAEVNADAEVEVEAEVVAIVDIPDI